MKIDKKLIKELVDNLKEFELTELEYQDGQTKIKVSKVARGVEQIKTSAVVPQNKAVLKSSDDSDGIRVKSPIIGTAYLAAEPGAKKFVEVGDKIKKGQTVMIVEAMKTMNHVPSTSNGEVKNIDDAYITAKKIGFPVLLKAAAGGGGPLRQARRTRKSQPSQPPRPPNARSIISASSSTLYPRCRHFGVLVPVWRLANAGVRCFCVDL